MIDPDIRERWWLVLALILTLVLIGAFDSEQPLPPAQIRVTK